MTSSFVAAGGHTVARSLASQPLRASAPASSCGQLRRRLQCFAFTTPVHSPAHLVGRRSLGLASSALLLFPAGSALAVQARWFADHAFFPRR